MPRRLLYALLALGLTPLAAPARGPAVTLPSGDTLPEVDFERHVMGLLSKTGCNSGSCHGSFQGKNGFRLSLFGYEPALDYAGIVRDTLARRVNTVRPDDSLLLLKATGQVPHEGGMRFGKGGWVYDVFRAWIAGGARWSPGRGTVTRLEVTPADYARLADGKPLGVRVTATFADGSHEDVTPFCDFRIGDESVATVSPLGVLTPQRPGDTALTVLYRGAVRAVRVLVPVPGTAPYPPVPEVNYIDREVFAKLRLLNVVPSDLAPDATFLRRVYIDTIAQLPTPEEVRAFLADPDPDKRAKVIDRLLAHPLHAALWATKFSDITGNNTTALENPAALQPKRSQMWHDWLRKRFADNVPYDRLVRDILTATSRDGRSPEEWIAFVKKIDEQATQGFATDYPDKPTLDLFWRRQQQVPIEVWGEKVAAAFLGVRLECAQCHKHPTDRWTQEDYWAFANLFAGVTFTANQFSSPEVKKLAEAENAARREAAPKANNNQILLVRELFVAANPGNRAKPNPATGKVPTPRALGGPEIPFKSGQDPRVRLADWMTAADNPFFARSFVNRVWAHYFGVGLVNPVDDFSLANPPTNPRLLDALAEAFVRSGYDIRRLERDILTSRAYQLDFVPNETNKYDTNNFSRAYVRPLMAEQVIDVLNSALGVEEPLNPGDGPSGAKVIEVGSSRITNANLAYALRIFGRPPRTTACDCERASEPALPQTLFRMTDPAILAKLSHPRGRVTALARSNLSDDQLVEELFLATLCRLPRPDEKAEAIRHLRQGSSRLAAITDLIWALINTREFILNH